MNKKIVGLSLLAVAVLVVGILFVRHESADSFEKNIRVQVANPAALIGDFKSFQKPEEVTNRLSAEHIAWQVTSDSKLGEKDSRPPFDDYSIKIDEYIDLDAKGVLELSFINKRLYKAVFYPGNYSDYLSKVSAKYKADFVGKSSVKVSDTVLIETGENSKGKFIQWIDEPLEREVSEWIKRYS